MSESKLLRTVMANYDQIDPTVEELRSVKQTVEGIDVVESHDALRPVIGRIRQRYEWAEPRPRAKTVGGQRNPPFEEDTMYVDCPGLVVPRNAKHFTVVGGIDLPTIAAGWQDFWIGGREDDKMNAGPRLDGKDTCQVKRWPAKTNGEIIQDGVFAFMDVHDVIRPDTGPGHSGHPDGYQIMCGKNIVWGGQSFHDMGYATQSFFIKGEAPEAGGGPVEDITLTDSTFARMKHWYSIRISKGVHKPKRITLRNLDLGGRNAAIWRGIEDLVTENITGGEVKFEGVI